MRFLTIAFLFVLSLNIAAQSPSVSKLSAEGTKAAKEQRFADALRSFKSALDLADNQYLDATHRARLRFNIGVCYFKLGKYDEAAESFKRALILKTDYTQAHVALGAAETRRRDWKATTASIKAAGQ